MDICNLMRAADTVNRFAWPDFNYTNEQSATRFVIAAAKKQKLLGFGCVMHDGSFFEVKNLAPTTSQTNPSSDDHS